jgi:hypothetical protein
MHGSFFYLNIGISHAAIERGAYIPSITMVSLWTWLVLVLKGKRRNLPFQNVSDNRTKIDLNLLVR